MTRRTWTTLQRAQIFLLHKGQCHLCPHKIDGGKERWDLEHIIPLAMGGKDEIENLAPAHVDCHKDKTKSDKANIAKAKRREAKHIGARAPSKWPKQKFNRPKFDNTRYVDRGQ